ncbi:hypothetical protein [Mycobacterium colombiense]|uniref:hypothetical protein n=1 Tax=Mycobacterium colombiense TaxID=339268 RepID=UPI0007FC4526|nr:hypothetical protein [Mycobacterium colombiense]OBJ67203.1 hypothetical protein A5627_03590 [Mycobacterium colombiense]
MKSKVIVLAAGVALSLFLVARYFALSRAGVPLGWMLYLGLPVTGAGVLFALRLLELGDGWRAGPDALRRGNLPTARPRHRSGWSSWRCCMRVAPSPTANTGPGV